MSPWSPSRGRDHRQAQALLPWYVTGQLDADESRRLKAHLDVCSACRAELAAESRLRDAIQSGPVEGRPMRAPRPRRLALAAGAIGAAGAIAASVALAVVILPAPRAPASQNLYRTLAAAPAPTTPQLVVMFDPVCSEAQMRSALARAHARIVDGPTAAGAYLLRVSQGSQKEALGALRGSPGVRLAQSLGGGG